MAESKLPRSAARRRDLLVFASVGVAAILLARGGSWVLDQVARDLNFIEVDDPRGFRRLGLIGTTSAAFDPFVGMETTDENPVNNRTVSSENLCESLFGRKSFQAGVVPVAFFSDYNCPNCELISEDLLEIEAEGMVNLKYHEWPIFGAPSETSARAAIAAHQQGARRMFNRRLQRTSLVPTDAYLRELAEAAGINSEQLFADMASEATTQELRTSALLVQRFAFPGTPALVVGRTIVIGTIRKATLNSLIAAESDEGPPPGC